MDKIRETVSNIIQSSMWSDSRILSESVWIKSEYCQEGRFIRSEEMKTCQWGDTVIHHHILAVSEWRAEVEQELTEDSVRLKPLQDHRSLPVSMKCRLCWGACPAEEVMSPVDSHQTSHSWPGLTKGFILLQNICMKSRFEDYCMLLPCVHVPQCKKTVRGLVFALIPLLIIFP